jgi:hypothetical protein
LYQQAPPAIEGQGAYFLDVRCPSGKVAIQGELEQHGVEPGLNNGPDPLLIYESGRIVGYHFEIFLVFNNPPYWDVYVVCVAAA